MTATELEPTSPAPDTWTQQLNQLKARYKHVRQPILVALNILLHDKNVGAADAKAQAELHGVRITAASIRAAQTLLSRMDAPPTATPAATATSTAPATDRAPRRPRTPQPPIDAEAMIRSFVDQLRGEKNAEVERMKDGIRKAIAALQAVVGA